MMRPRDERLVWVTGARGLLGAALVDTLARAGHAVLATGRELDITDRAALEAALGDRAPRCIFNAAAFTAVDDAESRTAEAFAINADGADNIATLARERGSDLVHFSTDYVFDGRPPQPLSEDAAPAPCNVYGRSKLDGERRVLATVDASRRVIVIRTSWLFGARGPSFVSRMLALLAEREELSVVDDQHGRPTAVSDLAEAALDLADLGKIRLAPPSGLYHFANAGVTTWHGFACAIREHALRLGLPVRARTVHPVASADFPRPAPRPRWSVLATDKFERASGRSPRPWTSALEATLRAP